MVVDRDEDDGVLIQKEAQAEKRLVEEAVEEFKVRGGGGGGSDHHYHHHLSWIAIITILILI